MPNEIEEYVKEFGDYLRNRKKSKTTVFTYTQAVRYLLTQSNKTPTTLNLKDIENFAIWVRDNFAPNSQKGKYSGIKKYLKFIKRQYRSKLFDEYITEIEDTDDDVLKPEPPELPEKETLTKAEIIKLFKIAEKNPRDHAILMIFLQTAQRVGSIQNLNISDIDFEGKQDENSRIYHEIIIRHAKGNKNYIVEVEPDVIDAINTYLKYREEPREGYILDNYRHKLYHKDALFLNGWGLRMTGQAMGKMMKRYAIRMGLKKRIYPHLFRATAITLMDEDGMTEAQIIKQTGHSDTKSLRTYIRPRDTVVREKVFNALSLNNKPTPKPDSKKPKEPKPVKPKPKEIEDKTDRYIALLKDGVIGKEEFLKLIESDKKSTTPSYYQ